MVRFVAEVVPAHAPRTTASLGGGF